MMFSTIVYLHADKYVPEATLLNWKVVIGDGTRIDQKKFAAQLIQVAVLYLRKHNFIELELQEKKVLFIKTTNLVLKKCKDDDGTLSGLEAEIMHSLIQDQSIYNVVRNIIPHDVMNPWSDLINITQRDLIEHGILDQDANGKVTPTQRYDQTSESSMQNMRDLNQSLEEVTNLGEIHKNLILGIEKGLFSRMLSD